MARALRRKPVNIQVAKGQEQVQAWIMGPLAIHRSVAIQGWTVMHLASGRKILSRIESKDAATAVVQRLLATTGCDWNQYDPVPDTARALVLSYLATVPRRAGWRKRMSGPTTKGGEQDG